MKNIPLNERIIFALDFTDPEEAKRWVEKVDSEIKFFKVGLILFMANGWWNLIDYMIKRGNKVMVDLKFFDIPETVYGATVQLKNRGITFATIHGNEPIIEAAVKDKGDMKVLAVTVLTSFDESDMIEMGFTKTVQDLVEIRARKALRLGCDGIVSSPLEAAAVRKEFGENFLIVTPGIRPGLNRDVIGIDDQKRIATAKQAIINGADHVVIGRPIRMAPDPISAIHAIQQEICDGLAICRENKT
ncbi:MAG: orotidine-5'-phosphate decarboxylase [Nitrospirota bacterium]